MSFERLMYIEFTPGVWEVQGNRIVQVLITSNAYEQLKKKLLCNENSNPIRINRSNQSA